MHGKSWQYQISDTHILTSDVYQTWAYCQNVPRPSDRDRSSPLLEEYKAPPHRVPDQENISKTAKKTQGSNGSTMFHTFSICQPVCSADASIPEKCTATSTAFPSLEFTNS